MKIDVKLGEPFWREIGQKEVAVELPNGASVQDLLDRLISRYPQLKDFLDHSELPPTIFLNDEMVSMDTPLNDGDCPTLLWAISGG
jgi:molybdopterin converting factor small subunit